MQKKKTGNRKKGDATPRKSTLRRFHTNLTGMSSALCGTDLHPSLIGSRFYSFMLKE